MKGERILIVVYDDGGLHAYAAAFTDKGEADKFALAVDGAIIDTFLDEHVLSEENESHD